MAGQRRFNVAVFLRGKNLEQKMELTDSVALL